MTIFARLLKEEAGTTVIEYGLITLLISIVAIGALTAIGAQINGWFVTANGSL